ncbi:MAG: porin family protein [Holosporaceae bacterium]|jgi:hypothetical protein|nr:porin family protein [Holosporaceae bacterium]
MKKMMIMVYLAFSVVDVLLAAREVEPDEARPPEEEFAQLGEPERDMGGAWVGLGMGLSRHTLEATADRNDGRRVTHERTDNLAEFALLAGFGTLIHKEYYTGIAMDLFKRLEGDATYSESRELGLEHNSSVGLNARLLFGCADAVQGRLSYLTVGFERVCGEALTGPGGVRGSFGSFFPSVGIGFERRLNSTWSLALEARRAITSGEEKRVATWKLKAKPNRTTIMIVARKYI